ncbi:helix-turn-helix domain-containing protein [Streptomyces albidoflavus]
MPKVTPLQPHKSARHEFGWKLRNARKAEEWSLEQLSSKVDISRSHLSRIETARYAIPPELPRRLDELFGRGREFQGLYAETQVKIHPDQYRRNMDLESQATAIRGYSPQVVPGLLQTEDFARAQFLLTTPGASEAHIEGLVRARMLRQRQREASAVPLTQLIDEAVLRRSCGTPGVMREQLAKLLTLPPEAHCTLRVLPFAYGCHALLGGSLALWTLPGGRMVAYEEAMIKGVVLTDKDEVAFRAAHYDLVASAALPPRDSADMIKAAMDDLP